MKIFQRKTTRSHTWGGGILTLYWPVERVGTVIWQHYYVSAMCLCSVLTWFAKSQVRAVAECSYDTCLLLRLYFLFTFLLDCGELPFDLWGQRSILSISLDCLLLWILRGSLSLQPRACNRLCHLFSESLEICLSLPCSGLDFQTCATVPAFSEGAGALNSVLQLHSKPFPQSWLPNPLDILLFWKA